MVDLVQSGRYQEALDRASRLLPKFRARFGESHALFAQILSLLAESHAGLGHFAEAESHHRRALAIREGTLGSNHPKVAESLNNLANVYGQMGRHAEAEPLYRRALAIFEETRGRTSPEAAMVLNNIGSIFLSLGRYDDAEPLLQRALAIREQTLRPNHPNIAESLNNLAIVYQKTGRYADAESLHKRTLAMREKALGPDHPILATSLTNLASVYEKLDRNADAEPLLKRALAIQEKTVGPTHPAVAASLDNLAFAYQAMGRNADAAPLRERALAIRKTTLGPDHPAVAKSWSDLAALDFKARNLPGAVDHSREAVRAVAARLSKDMVAGLGADIASFRNYLDWNLFILDRARAENRLGPEAAAEAFEAAQWANQTSAAAALNQMAARFAGGSDALAALVRERQDAAAERRRLDKGLLAEISKPASRRDHAGEAAAIRDRMAELDSRLARLDARLAAEFPRFADLVSPKPLSVPEAQKLLGPGEALLAFHVGYRYGFVWAVTRDRAEWRRLKPQRADLEKRVGRLRAALDPDAPTNGSVLFDLEAAHALHAELLGPVQDVIADKPALIVVASGALTSLPFHVLVTEKPSGKAASLADYGSAAWLARRHAVTVLPSVASLKTLREIASRSRAPQPYLGFGDPVFSRGPQQLASNAPHRSARAGLAYRGYFRGARADLDGLSRALPPLPDTADELRAVARTLGVPESQIKLREDASERTVKTLPLANYRILHFATHALVAGETALFNEQAEPALALSLPQTPSDLDDGLLTSSEVAGLKLNADWVILSACNTAAGDKPGAEALSGLARAFFYAGARTLLVSHWPVDSQAAVRLTTGTIQALETDRSLTPAEGLRRAMLALMNDTTEPQSAYPGIWAPFVVVGESR